MMSRLRAFAAAVAALAAVAAAPRPPAVPAADRIFLGGRIWTADPPRPRAQALALAGDAIVAVGTDAEVRRHVGPATTTVDLRGRFVAPGFNDAHLHFLVVDTVDLADAGSRRGDPAPHPRLRAPRIRSAPGSTGRGWVYGAFPGGLPAPPPARRRRPRPARLHDQLRRPQRLGELEGPGRRPGSRATRPTRITASSCATRRGEPTGALKESAARLVGRLVPPPTDEERYAALKRRLDEAASYGLTSAQNASIPAADLPAYERVAAEGGLKVRFYFALPMVKDIAADELARYKALADEVPRPADEVRRGEGIRRRRGGIEDGGHARALPGRRDGRAATGRPTTWTARWPSTTARDSRSSCTRSGTRPSAWPSTPTSARPRTNGTAGRRHRVEHIEAPTRGRHRALQAARRDRLHPGPLREPRPEHTPRSTRPPSGRIASRGPWPSAPSTRRAPSRPSAATRPSSPWRSCAASTARSRA